MAFQGFLRAVCAVSLLLALISAAHAQAAPQVPNYIDPRERISAPDLSTYSRIRFLTTVDFPPFNFIDQSGKLAGFHADLARAVCEVLEVLDKCQLQALPWAELETALSNDQGEAVIAGVAMTAESREKFIFTRPYLELPARFAVRRQQELRGETAAALAGVRIGVIDGTAHEAMLRAWFPDIRPVTFSRSEWLYEALRKGSIAGMFGDGVQISFWLQSEGAAGCCRFFDGPFLSSTFLGEGLAIAVAPEDRALATAFDHALAELSRNGRFAELYLRWFPNGLY